MAASSLINLSLSSHCFRTHTSKSQSRTLIVRSSSSSLHRRQELRQPAAKLQNPLKPTTNTSFLAFFSPAQKKILNSLVEKIATLLLALIFAGGSVKARPAVAAPVQESEVFEEKRNGMVCDDEGEEMCEKLLQENPKDVEALKMVVNVKMRRGKTGEAVEVVEKLVELQPNEMEWRLLQALCYEMMGDLSKAKRLFKNVLKQGPLLLRALHGLAIVMHKNHEGPAVFDMLERALEVALREKKVNEERNIRILVAQMHLVKGDLEMALKKFQALIDENSRDFRPYLCQGIVYSMMDKKKEADESFATYQRLVPDEFPQRGFLDDVVLSAKSESKQKLEKDLQH